MSTDVSDVRPASIIALMMEAVRTSETSVNIQLRTRQYIPEDAGLHEQIYHKLKPITYDEQIQLNQRNETCISCYRVTTVST
jgi:hypothetical protein